MVAMGDGSINEAALSAHAEVFYNVIKQERDLAHHLRRDENDNKDHHTYIQSTFFILIKDRDV